MNKLTKTSFKKIAIWALIISFVIITPVATVSAETEEAKASAEIMPPILPPIGPGVAMPEDAEIKFSATDALLKVKELIVIPTELDKLQTDYQADGTRKTWNFRWYAESGDEGEVNVRLDANTGEIVNFYRYVPYEQQLQRINSYLPKISWQAGMIMAERYVTKFTDKQAGDYKMISEPQFPLHKGSKQYEYVFEQVVDGIKFHNQTINVNINADTGELNNFYHNWLALQFDNSPAKITKQEAEQKFKQMYELELAYIMNYQTKKPMLVYKPVNQEPFVIDARTGEKLELNRYYDDRFAFGAGGMEQMVTADKAVQIQEFEQLELDNLAGLLSQAKALSIAKVYVDVPAEYRQTTVNLERSWQFPDNRNWVFRWEFHESQPEREQRYGSIEVGIDAKTGKLVRLYKYSYPEDGYEVREGESIVIQDQAAAEARAQEYITKIYPEYMADIRLSSAHGSRYLEVQEKNLSWSLSYERMVDGIAFADNNINIGINAKTGEINHFNITWAELDFPAATGVVDSGLATDNYLESNPLVLHYRKDMDYQNQTINTVLVYSFLTYDVAYIDAFSGLALNYQAEPVDKSKQAYTDVGGHWSAEQVRFMEKYGLLTFVGSELNPDKLITQGEFMEILLKIERPYLPIITPMETSRFVRENALYIGDASAGNIWNEVKASQELTREDMAQLIVQFMNYHEIAALDIFNAQFSDASEISADRRGAAAIMNGMGIMTGGTNQEFMPNKKTSRAEAIVTLARMLQR